MTDSEINEIKILIARLEGRIENLAISVKQEHELCPYREIISRSVDGLVRAEKTAAEALALARDNQLSIVRNISLGGVGGIVVIAAQIVAKTVGLM